ncbi:hypothetical protein P4S73_24785 [Paraglaciecola sp. Hal342]
MTLYSVGTTDALDINDVDYAATYAYIVQQSLDIESTTLKLDAERMLTVFGQSATIKAGVSYNQRDADGDAGTTYFGAFPSDSVDIGDYLTSTPGIQNSPIVSVAPIMTMLGCEMHGSRRLVH